MSDNVKQPAVRFAGHADDWEQRKVSEIGTFSKGTGYSKSDIRDKGTPLILYGRLYTKYETVIREVDTFTTPKDGSVYSRGGEVIIPASGETAEDISIASVVEKSGVILGGDLNIVTPQSGIDSAFLALSISHGEAHRSLSKLAQGKSVVHIHNSDIQTVEVGIPVQAEQESISQFFEGVDRLITLHQRKYDQLVNIKKSMLEKMFPKNGELVPEVRFAGFTDAWEQRKIGDLCSRTTGGGTPRTGVSEYWDGEIPWFQSSDFKEGIVTTQSSNKHITQEGLKESAAQLIPAQSIAIVARVGFGKLALIPFQYTTSQDILSLSNLTIAPLYGVYSIYKKLQSELMAVQGTSIKGVTKDDLLAKDITVSPNTSEQRKIGDLFQSLDTLITLHQRKLERLQNIKKACLEKMFV